MKSMSCVIGLTKPKGKIRHNLVSRVSLPSLLGAAEERPWERG